MTATSFIKWKKRVYFHPRDKTLAHIRFPILNSQDSLRIMSSREHKSCWRGITHSIQSIVSSLSSVCVEREAIDPLYYFMTNKTRYEIQVLFSKYTFHWNYEKYFHIHNFHNYHNETNENGNHIFLHYSNYFCCSCSSK